MTNGYLELVLMAACEIGVFYSVAEWLTKKAGIAFCSKSEGEGVLGWHFTVSRVIMTLRYDAPVGIRLYPAALANSTHADRAVFENFVEHLKNL